MSSPGTSLTNISRDPLTALRRKTTGQEIAREVDAQRLGSGWEDPAGSPGLDLLRQRVVQQLKALVGHCLKTTPSVIEADEPLENYGIDWAMTSLLNGQLAEVFEDLSPTLFFEYRTLGEAAAYFCAAYPEACRRWTNTPAPTATPADPYPAAMVEEYVKGVIYERLALALCCDARAIDPEETFADYGLDSLFGVRLVRTLGKILGIELETTSFFDYCSVNQLAGHIATQYGGDVARRLEQGRPLPAPGRADAVPAAVLELPSPPPAPAYTLERRPGPLDIAIIGLAGRYPLARNVKEFWKNLQEGRDCITEIPRDRWNHNPFFDARRDVPGKTYGKWGGFVEGVDEFDPLFFNISPREAEFMDPQERMFLQCVYETLEDAGYRRNLRQGLNVGMYVGVMYLEYPYFSVEETLRGRPRGSLATAAGVANRASYCCNFTGPSLVVDTMCASSLTTIHLACQDIVRGHCELAVAGGVNVSIHPNKYLMLGQGHFLSSKGRCETFGGGGDGYVPGEGVGAILLKPLNLAIADGDHIYGVIRGTAINHGGRVNGYTVPSPRGQAAVIGKVFRDSGIDPRTVSYVEAHGTGTALGDPIEIAGLTKAFRAYTPDSGFCAIGSAKSNIGHCEAAAGIAAVTKVLLQLKHGQLAPSLHAADLNPQIDFQDSPFVVQQRLAEWQRPRLEIDGRMAEVPRIAGVSAFGAGGCNAHVLIEEYIPAAEPSEVVTRAGRPALIVLSAWNEDRLKEQVRRLLSALEEEYFTESDLLPIAYTLQVGREPLEDRLAVIVNSLAELKEKLQGFLAGRGAGAGFYRGQVRRNKELLSRLTGDGDMAATSEAWLAEQQYHKLLDFWVKGLAVNWEKLYGGLRPRRVSLPTYPFARDRYWIVDRGIPRELSSVTAGAATAVLHPLLQRNTSTFARQRFSSTFSGREFFLADHVVNGRKVLPGVAYLEMARAAVARSTGLGEDRFSQVRIKNVMWMRPFLVDQVPETLHIGLTPEANGQVSFEAFTLPSGGPGTPVVHCQGTVDRAGVAGVPAVDLAMVRSRHSARALPGKECYAAFAAMGMLYGPAHKGIERLYIGDGRLLARLTLPPAVVGTQEQFVLHPSLLDAAMQTPLGLGLGGDQPAAAAGPVVLFALEEFELHRPLPAEAWAVVRYSAGSGPDEGLVKFDYDLCDNEGNVCARIRKVSSRAVEEHAAFASPSQSMPADIGTLMLRPAWRESPAPAAGPAAPYASQWVALCGGIGPLPEESAGNPASRRRLALDPGLGAIDERYRAGAGRLFHHLQKVLAEKPPGPVLVQVAVPAGRAGHLFSGLTGLLKTARLENPRLLGQVLEVEESEPLETLLAKLEENARSPEDEHIRYRSGIREVHRWQEVAPAGPVEPCWRNQGIYLITGGAGGLGLIFAREIARQAVNPTLVLTGRSALSPEKQSQIEALRALGAQVLYRQADVEVKADVEGLIRELLADQGSLQGIIHCAGVLRDSYILKKTKEELQQVLGPKVAGTVHLDEACRDLDLDLFLLFSSVAGATGNPGQADYAAGNAFLDAFAVYRNRLVAAGQRSGRTVSINWPLWKEGGMSVGDEVREMLRRSTGMTALDTGAGIQALYRSVASGYGQVLVVAGELGRLRHALLGGMARPAAPSRNTSPVATVREKGNLLEELRNRLMQMTSDFLKIKTADLDLEIELTAFGFDSVVMMQFRNQLAQVFGLELPPTIFFDYPTLGSFADHLLTEHEDVLAVYFGGARVTVPSALAPVPVPVPAEVPAEVPADNSSPLSEGQQGLWLLQHLSPDMSAYNAPLLLQVEGKIDPELLRKACAFTVEQHPLLSVVIREEDGELTQTIPEGRGFGFAQENIEHLGEEEVFPYLQCRYREPFDLEKGSPMRAFLFSRSEAEHYLLFAFHHIVIDGMSNVLFLETLQRAYNEYYHGRLPAREELPASFFDFVRWEREMLSSEEGRRHLEFWKERLSGDLPVLRLPTDRPRARVPRFAGGTVEVKIDPELAQQARDWSRAHNVRLSVLFLGVLKTLLYRYSGQEDLIVGMLTLGRPERRFARVVGNFANAIAIRTRLDPERAAGDFLKALQAEVFQALDHSAYPFPALVRQLEGLQDRAVAPVFQVYYTYQSFYRPDTVADASGSARVLNLKWIEKLHQEGDADFGLEIYERDDHFLINAGYRTALFNRSSIERLMAHFTNLLAQILRDASRSLADLPLMSEPETVRLLSRCPAGRGPHREEPRRGPAGTVPDLFRARVAIAPASPAVLFAGTPEVRLTYGQLEEQANRLARQLIALRVQPGTRVGLCLERCPEMIMGLLAIWKTGATYVPLDPAHPAPRLEFIRQDAGLGAILMHDRTAPLLRKMPGDGVTLVNLDRDGPCRGGRAGKSPRVVIDPHQPAYILYTSGSTGRPKGVAVCHASLAEHCRDVREAYELSPDDRILQFAPLSVDASLEQIVPGLICGASLIVRGEEIWSAAEFYRKIVEQGISVIDVPPAYLRELTDRGNPVAPSTPSTLRLVIAGGEVLPAETAALWRRSPLGAARLINAYGPTEATITSTVYEIPRQRGMADSGASVPIGRPLGRRKALILNRHLHPVPEGVAGELYLGGSCLALGYLNQPRLTAERFVSDPFGKFGERLYRTGDLARYIPGTDGQIEFLGRADQQVKVRGFRIELEEVEARLGEFPGIREGAVAARPGAGGDMQLIGYVVPVREPVLPEAIEAFLQETLPPQMIPSAWVGLDKLPRNGSGKVDRRALPELATTPRGMIAEGKPRNDIERELLRIWHSLLATDRLDLEDSFFDRGGNSLLAIRLISLVRKRLAVDLPVAALIAGPTIAELAVQIRLRKEADSWGPLLCLQEEGKLPPLFLMHPIGGGVLVYRELVRLLGRERPVYGLQSPGLEEGGGPIPATVEEQAAAYIQRIRMVRPQGPYLLAGWSYGGLVAYEMARQLQSAGEQDVLLAMIDSYTPEQARQVEKRHLAARGMKHRNPELRFLLSFALNLLGPESREELSLEALSESAGDPEALFEQIVFRAGAAGLISQSRVEEEVRRLLRVYKANSEAMESYHPQPYGGPVTFFCAQDPSRPAQAGMERGWQDPVAGEWEVHAIPADHYSILQHPGVDKLAERMLMRSLVS